MFTKLEWSDKHSFEDQAEAEAGSCIYSLAFKPDGTQLLVAIGTRIIVYDPNDGTVIIALKGHKELVYAVSFAFNGERFASGSQDRSVTLWSDQNERLLKYTHNDPVQCIAFSPTTMTLLSCAVSDFGIWTQNDKNVSKQKVHTKCTSCAWSLDGCFYAVGFFDGTVTVRSTSGPTPTGEETARLERPGCEPVWALHFAQIAANNQISNEMLVVADWAQSIGFYAHSQGQVSHRSDKQLDYDPTAVHLFSNGCFFLSIGSNRKLNLHTVGGIDLGAMSQLDAWPWSMVLFKQQFVVVGCVDGSLVCYRLMLNTIHALHHNHYAFRDNQTDVVVQHLEHQKSTRIRCQDLVRKVAIYNNRLAIQLTDRVLIYRQSAGEREGEPLEYKLIDRISQNFECSLLVITSQHLILCQNRRLTCYDLKGIKQREWIMDSMMKYIKVVGGPPGRETILAGMCDGLVSKIFVDNPFPVEVVRLKTAICCVDISLSMRKLATVDEKGICVLYDTEQREILNQEPNVSTVTFNSANEDLVCYSGHGVLNIKSHWFTPYQQRLEPSQQGFVVGFMGKSVYIITALIGASCSSSSPPMHSKMQSLEIPVTSQLLQFLDNNMFKEAYELASLGVTEHDWKLLGSEALEHMEFEVARKAFFRIRDCRSLLLVNELTEMKSRGASADELRAHLYAHSRRFRECVQLLQRLEMEQKALEMFADLRMFDKAQELLSLASQETQKLLLRRKADWAQSTNDQRLMASVPDMLMASGDYDKAIRLMMANGWVEKVANAARKLDRSDTNLLREIGQFMAQKGEYTMAASIFQRISDTHAIVQMHVDSEHWEDAFALVTRHSALSADVYLPYARWLAERDRFDEAQIAYNKAGHEKEAARVLEQLTENAVRENRFKAASFYYRRRAEQLLETIETSGGGGGGGGAAEESAKFAQRWLTLADIYFAYEPVFKYVMEPFTDKSLDTLFHAARFLVLHPPTDFVSRTIVLYTLMRLSRHFANFKTARQALEQLRQLKAPPHYQAQIDVATLEIRAMPFSDAEEYQPLCYSCGTRNPILGSHECVHCSHPFVYSFITFEVLPLVQFHIADGIEDDEAIRLINMEPPPMVDTDTQTNDFIMSELAMNKKKKRQMKLDREHLLRLGTEVFTHNRPSPMRTSFYLKVIKEVKTAKCPNCQKFFNSDDFQMAVLQLGQCPVCQGKVQTVNHEE
uniref:Intraflagellar transport protein 122 homolog n=1 Tax=Globodera rostochiensis TaxID=31243 RepID=A0A914HDV0_GLORO